METTKKKKPKKQRIKMKSRKLRFSESDMNRIQLRADMYADGNFSKWVRYAALNAPGVMVKPK